MHALLGGNLNGPNRSTPRMTETDATIPSQDFMIGQFSAATVCCVRKISEPKLDTTGVSYVVHALSVRILGMYISCFSTNL